MPARKPAWPARAPAPRLAAKPRCATWLEIRFEGELQLPRGVDLAARAGQDAEGLALQLGRPGTEANAVEDVEGFGAELDAAALLDREGARDGDVLVEVVKEPQFGIQTRDVADAVQRGGAALRREWSGAVRNEEVIFARVEGAAGPGRLPAIVRSDVGGHAAT